MAVKLAAVETAKPLIPANQVDIEIAKTATAKVLKEFTNPIDVNARDNSLIAKIRAIETSPAKITRSKTREAQISAISASPTMIDGSNLRPARLLIASFMECKSLTGM